jgi:plasmid replication initiation protein
MNINDKALTVRQSNSLINASYRIASVGEGRLIRTLIAQISPSDEDFKLYRVSVSDFARLFDITGQSAYEQIKKAADELVSRKIRIEKGESWLIMNWLSSAEYVQGSGYVEFRFEQKLKPYLLQLKGYFTQYQLENIVTFKSSYSIRLYELLKTEQFKAKHYGQFKKVFEYSEIRAMMGMNETEYAFFKDFRVRVIDPSVREINASSGIEITQVEYPKTGRKISHIVFHCGQVQQTRLKVGDTEPLVHEVDQPQELPNDIQELVSMGIHEATAYKWRKKYGVRRLSRNLAYTQAMKQAGKIRDSVSGFLARAIADDLGGAWEEEAKQTRKVRDNRAEQEQFKQDEENAQKNAEIAERATMMQVFQSLTPEEQQAHRKAYANQATGLYLKMWQSANEASSDAPETDKRVLVLFLNFFRDQSKQEMKRAIVVK